MKKAMTVLRADAMRTQVARTARQGRYRLRKQTVGRFFGQIEQVGGFRQFLVRGIEKVKLARLASRQTSIAGCRSFEAFGGSHERTRCRQK
jgi:hypothetical protein